MDRTKTGKKQISKKNSKKAKKNLQIRGPFAKNSSKNSSLLKSKKSSLKNNTDLNLKLKSKNIKTNVVQDSNILVPITKMPITKNDNAQEYNEVYFPQEDSSLLKELSKKFARGMVLEMGCGSGYVLCSLSSQIDFGVGLDINPLAVRASEKYSKIEANGNLWFFQSNLFSFLENFSIEIFMGRMWLRKGKTKQIFDYILFNPPYLPDESDTILNDIALNAGKAGTEVIEGFLKSFKFYLKPDGKALIIVSSIILDKFLVLLDKYKIHFLLAGKKSLFYEELYCYQIW